MTEDWKGYQEEAAALFRSMGLDANTDVTLNGARTSHAVDVVVKSHHAGFDVTWLVECKHWKTPVSKLHVLGLRQIVVDLGADRGIILCESGFQSGAIEAANLTNVQLTTLEQVRATAGGDIAAMRLRELYDRLEVCRVQYWDLPKYHRIEHGLRGDLGDDWAYSGTLVLEACAELLARSLRGIYPIQLINVAGLIVFGRDREFLSVQDVVSVITAQLCELEQKLSAAIIAFQNQAKE
ncbi:hypothetical protein HNP48_005656 [Acidovorax soli]|uniref:Restriction endonuclease type IV Mrr domain-containing protein n=1 Tax=Acidovorax soli TaxID=592050 RepID=A0A7X0PJV6_9BURK|nr:restriction endonuclease [Acidovorax soli]MBB6562939.1 hypothetical protein [Acidovorax soli]